MPNMDPFTKSFVNCVCFYFFLNLASAFDDEFEKKWQEMHKQHVSYVESIKDEKLSVPIEVAIGFGVMLVIGLSCFIITCVCTQRHPEMLRARSQPLTSAQHPVMSGANAQPTVRVFTPFPGASPTPRPQVYTVIPGATAASVSMYSQLTYCPQTVATAPLGSAYASDIVAPPVQPAATLLPSQPAPRSHYGHACSKDISKVPLCRDF